MKSRWVWLLFVLVILVPGGVFFGCSDDGLVAGDEEGILRKSSLDDRTSEVGEPFFGDLDEVFKRGYLRVLVAPSRTNFFFDKKDLRGFDVEFMRSFCNHLNRGRKRAERVRLLFVPRPYGDLLPSLVAGIGDVAIGGMTVMPSREKETVFSDPYLTGVEEVVVHNRSVEDIERIEDLAGRMVTVRADSSYEVHLEQLGEDFRQRGLAGPVVRNIGSSLATEDVLEMVNAGILEISVADRHLADAWAAVMPDLIVRHDLVIHKGGALAVAVRPADPMLLEAVNRFIGENKKGSLLGNVLFARYFEKRTWLKNPNAAIEDIMAERIAELFRQYADRYGFDWLDIAAQAYRESRFDQSKVSGAGAVGIMQIRPSTAADSNVGITGIDDLENNIHAGVKYLAFVRDRYFSDTEISDRVNFAMAAYNAGPRRIVAARKIASEEGLDPDRWFHNVELVVARTVGREPVEYVRDIHAYAFALRLGYNEGVTRELERRSVRH
jgi:membrane-bound lytic murein transglycosylase MltF